MQTFQQHNNSIDRLYQQPIPKICISPFSMLDDGSQGSDSRLTNLSFQTYNDEHYHTLDSSQVAGGFSVFDSSIVSVVSNSTYSSPVSVSSVSGDDALRHKLQELETVLLGPELNMQSTSSCKGCIKNTGRQAFGSGCNWGSMIDTLPSLELNQALVSCAQAIAENDEKRATGLMDMLERMVSVSGDPIQRLGAYLLEGLKARLISSGSQIYKKLKCKEPTGTELLSYMHVLYQICPYWKFAYVPANEIIKEVMEKEPSIHIIDFQIAQGTQWVDLIQALASRPGGPPRVRITGIDDSHSTYARSGGLEIVGQMLSNVARSCNVPFEFHSAGVAETEVELEHLFVQQGEARAVNFPYVLHHVPDESVSTENHRDRLLRLVKSLSPKIVTLVEQESNTNTSSFLNRFMETLDYYTAMFQSIDVARPRNDKQRINAEQHCVARDIVNMIACEGSERVERHELFGKWRSRFQMAGFQQCQLSSGVTNAVLDMLREFNQNYNVQERDGALYLRWINRDLTTCSAWR